MSDFHVELRLNNTIFFCIVHKEYFNIDKKPAFAVQLIDDIVSDPRTGKPAVAMKAGIICDDCYKNPALALKDPSPIIKPEVNGEAIKEIVTNPSGSKS